MGLLSDAQRVDPAIGGDGLHLHQGSWNESQRGKIARQVRIIITHTLHDDLLPWEHRREWLATWNAHVAHGVRDGVTMRILRWALQQCIHALPKFVRNGMLNTFRPRIDRHQTKSHAADAKE